MKRFPAPVREAMRAGGAAATCVPVQIDDGAWETALFFQLGGPESKADRRALGAAGGPVPVGLETDLVETAAGAVAVLRASLEVRPDDPAHFEILLTPGAGGTHFEALGHLARQPRLCWFFGDRTFWLLHSQCHPLDAEHRAEFESLLRDASRHDALTRVTSRYDAQAALGEVAKHYELRGTTNASGALPPPVRPA